VRAYCTRFWTLGQQAARAHLELLCSTENSTPSLPENTTLIFDSGASKSTLCNFYLLVDPKPVTKLINTYSSSINITHIGKFKLGGTLIYPVYFAPNGPCNLVSASQLEDHGLRVIFKNWSIFICLGQKVIYWFPRVGNLYQGLAP
jgi:hypothetical protein